MQRRHAVAELRDPAILRFLEQRCEAGQVAAFRQLVEDERPPELVPAIPAGPLVVSAQIQRSGGTLVEHLFDHHPDCLTFPGELYLHPTSQVSWARFDLAAFDARRIFAELLAVRALQTEKYLKGGYSRYSSAATGRMTLPFVFSPAVQYQTFMHLIGEAGAPNQRQIVEAYLSSFFTAWLDYQRRYSAARYTVAFFKRLNWAEEAERFFADYPDGLMITNVRRPDDWLASARRHDPNGYGDARRALDAWCDSAQASIAAARRWPERVFVVGFEQLVGDTERVMSSLAGRLGIAFDPILLTPTFNGMQIESDSSFEPRVGVDRDVIGRAGRHLGVDEANLARGRPMELYEESMTLAV